MKKEKACTNCTYYKETVPKNLYGKCELPPGKYFIGGIEKNIMNPKRTILYPKKTACKFHKKG